MLGCAGVWFGCLFGPRPPAGRTNLISNSSLGHHARTKYLRTSPLSDLPHSSSCHHLSIILNIADRFDRGASPPPVQCHDIHHHLSLVIKGQRQAARRAWAGRITLFCYSTRICSYSTRGWVSDSMIPIESLYTPTHIPSSPSSPSSSSSSPSSSSSFSSSSPRLGPCVGESISGWLGW